MEAVIKTIVSESKAMIVGQVGETVPGVDVIVALYDSVIDEVDRAQAAANEVAMEDWISTTRQIISDCYGNSRCDPRNRSEKTVLGAGDINDDIVEALCDVPSNRRETSLITIRRFAANLAAAYQSIPGLRVYEKVVYESWINSQFDEEAEGMARAHESAPGTIEIVWDVEDGDEGLEFDEKTHSARTISPGFGDRVDRGLNRIIDELSSSSIRYSPWDFKVRKKICFMVDNTMGGRSKVCWLLDKDNSVIRRGIGTNDMAERAYGSGIQLNGDADTPYSSDEEWFTKTRKFRESGKLFSD